MKAIYGVSCGTQKGKHHYAVLLRGKRKSFYQKRERLPSEEELSQITSDISIYESRKNEADVKSDTLTKLQRTAESYRWAEKDWLEAVVN